jgi:hypothetical protein
VTEARTRLVSLEDLSDKELDRLHDEFQHLKRSPAARAPAVVTEASGGAPTSPLQTDHVTPTA